MVFLLVMNALVDAVFSGNLGERAVTTSLRSTVSTWAAMGVRFCISGVFASAVWVCGVVNAVHVVVWHTGGSAME